MDKKEIQEKIRLAQAKMDRLEAKDKMNTLAYRKIKFIRDALYKKLGEIEDVGAEVLGL